MSIVVQAAKGSPFKITRVNPSMVAINRGGRTMCFSHADIVAVCHALVDLMEEGKK